MRLYAVLFAVLALLNGCASSKIMPLQIRPLQAELAPFAFNGRVATLHNDERSSASLRWTHSSLEDGILLLAPLGQTVARIHADTHGVTLEASGKLYAAPDAESLTEEVLGWRLPMSGMRYWVLALPAPGEQALIEHDALGQVSFIRQDGWEIQYLRYASLAPDSLPLRLVLKREGMEIKLFIDEWETQ
ncbi:MAG: lipoprotein insertase outer membrane protein LolB [Gallionellaceae bacterium]|jgi:outer membrane lipoprotein LolB